jgi:hypothetical protein
MMVLVVSAALLAGMGLVVATGAGGIVRPVGDFADQPVIDFEGRVFDHASGKGLPDAYVIVNVVAYSEEPVTAFGALGCAAGEVVRTDSQGRYRFRLAWAEYGETPPSKVSVRLKAYAPGWEYFPRERRLGTSWQSTHAEGPNIAMTKDEATFEERMAFISKLNDNPCQYGPRAASFSALYRAQHSEVWMWICAMPSEPSNGLAWERFRTLEAYALSPIAFSRDLDAPPSGETERYRRYDELTARARRNLPAFQRPDPSLGFRSKDRDLNAEEREIACHDYSPAAIDQGLRP